MASFRLPVVIERVEGSYQATSPALSGFLVLADTLDEVLALAPDVARALLQALGAKGLTPPLPLEEVQPQQSGCEAIFYGRRKGQ